MLSRTRMHCVRFTLIAPSAIWEIDLFDAHIDLVVCHCNEYVYVYVILHAQTSHIVRIRSEMHATFSTVSDVNAVSSLTAAQVQPPIRRCSLSSKHCRLLRFTLPTYQRCRSNAQFLHLSILLARSLFRLIAAVNGYRLSDVSTGFPESFICNIYLHKTLAFRANLTGDYAVHTWRRRRG